jgi:hypothetical protein
MGDRAVRHNAHLEMAHRLEEERLAEERRLEEEILAEER